MFRTRKLKSYLPSFKSIFFGFFRPKNLMNINVGQNFKYLSTRIEKHLNDWQSLSWMETRLVAGS